MAFGFDIYNDIPIEKRKEYQVVGTPDWIWDRMVSKLTIDPKATYLDPCVGRGPGIKALLKAGVKQEQITAIDILPENVEFCKAIYPNVNYQVCDLLTLKDHYDYVVGVPPWVRKLPAMINLLEFISKKQCVLLAPFFYGNKAYSKVANMVDEFYHPDFNDLVRFALSGSQHFGVPCVYEFRRDGNGLRYILAGWLKDNNLWEFFTPYYEESVPANLVLYEGQEYFLPINPVWFLPYVYSGFDPMDVGKLSIFGKINPKRKCYGLVYDSQSKLDKAREHYSSMTVRKMLSCGQNFGWRCLRAV